MSIILILYLIYIFGFIVFSVLGLYHLWKYGFQGDITKIVMATYVIVSFLIILFSLVIIMMLDWGSFKTPHIDSTFFNFLNR